MVENRGSALQGGLQGSRDEGAEGRRRLDTMVLEQIVSLYDSGGELTSVGWHKVVPPGEAVAAFIGSFQGGPGSGFQGGPGPGPQREDSPAISPIRGSPRWRGRRLQ